MSAPTPTPAAPASTGFLSAFFGAKKTNAPAPVVGGRRSRKDRKDRSRKDRKDRSRKDRKNRNRKDRSRSRKNRK